MKFLTWATLILAALLGGIFLMPYKTAAISEYGVVSIIACATVAGFVSGFWLIRPTKRYQIIPLQFLSASFFIAGLIGITINFSLLVSGTPVLAILMMFIGFGMINFWLISRYRHAQ